MGNILIGYVLLKVVDYSEHVRGQTISCSRNVASSRATIAFRVKIRERLSEWAAFHSSRVFDNV